MRLAKAKPGGGWHQQAADANDWRRGGGINGVS